MNFLIIRRDNIGDLVCTTPLFRALRTHFPQSKIFAYVNRYNAPVLDGNPDIDHVFSYTKLKHRAPEASLFHLLRNRLQILFQLRRKSIDYAILAGSGFRRRELTLARLFGARHIIGYRDPNHSASKHIDLPVQPLSDQNSCQHEVEQAFRLLEPLSIQTSPPALRLIPNSQEILAVQQNLTSQSLETERLIGVHISARKPGNRWPLTRFSELMHELWKRYHRPFLLLWSPGDETDPRHPGDDHQARALMKMGKLRDIPVIACPTHHLSRLIGAMALCDMVICSDGGAMHLAAALKKPILCFFGPSDPTHWHPWKTEHLLLHPPSRDVADISIEEALEGFSKLLKRHSRGDTV